MIGRDETVQRVAEELSSRRFVTIVGPGGIGKTTVAVAVAHAVLPAFDGAVHFLDLSSFSDGRLVPNALASMLGLLVESDNAVASLLTLLKDERMLLVLDTCERVIETVAVLAEGTFEKAPDVHILATSRESLRAEGEHVHRLFPLKCPPQDVIQDIAEILAYPAAQLFFERVIASAPDFELSYSDAPGVVEICAKLDGIPLAIELAAGRVAAYGIRGVASLLNDRFGLLWHGRRTALPRHQTLGATLDWSYDLLPEFEKVVLRRLAVFVGFFSLDAARAVVAGDGVDEEQVLETIADLVAKSLVAPAIDATPVHYRLLDMTHAYVLGKPIDKDVVASIARRHAAYFLQFLERAASSDSAEDDGSTPLRQCLGNVRAALEWCFSADGDHALGVDLAAASSRYFLEMSLLTECHRWADRAILANTGTPISARRELALQYSIGISLMFTRGNTEEVATALTRGLEIAEALDDMPNQLRLLSGLHIYSTRISDFRGALDLGQRSIALAKKSGDPASMTMAEWMSGVAHHLIGNQAEACVQCESATKQTPIAEWGNIGRLGYDRRIIALVAHARALWLTGLPDQAAEVARYTVEEAEALDNPQSLCISLIWTTFVFLWIGEWSSARETIERLIAHAAKHSLRPHHAFGLGLKGDLSIRLGEPLAGIRLLRESLETVRANRHQILVPIFMSTQAEGLAMIGQLDEAIAAIDGAIAQVGDGGDSFAIPEMLRIKGEILRSLARPDSGAEACLLQSLDWARKQSSLGWELRTAMNLARLWSDDNRHADALALLKSVYERFTEGFDTSDLTAARLLLGELGLSPDPWEIGQ
jgi:predicted ATPase